MTARKHVAVCARARGVDLARVQRSHRAPANPDVVLLTPERPLAALAQPMGAA